MVRKAILISLAALFTAPAAFADPARALRDIALTSMAVQRNRTVESRRAALDRAFDAAATDFRDAPNDPSVRGREGSSHRKNWFTKGSWYAPQPRRPFNMPALDMPARRDGVLARMGISFQTALAPWKQLLSAASQSSWSSVAIVRTLAG